MLEILLWTLAVFVVLAGLPLLGVLREWQRERRAAQAKKRQERGDRHNVIWPFVLVAGGVL